MGVFIGEKAKQPTRKKKIKPSEPKKRREEALSS
jgi:hypothetical protein